MVGKKVIKRKRGRGAPVAGKPVFEIKYESQGRASFRNLGPSALE